MIVYKKLTRNGASISFKIDEPTICPICKHAIKPEELYFEPYKYDLDKINIAALYLCKHCFKVFTALYDVDNTSWDDTMEPLYVAPNLPEHKQFQSEISALSPQFVKIYNQAAAAETYELDEIAGMGYRKALEFLIKDYLIHTSPEKSEEIKTKALGACINDIKSPQIQALSSRSAWIGNDEAHYVRKHTDLDTEDLKRFIHALIGYISMSLTAEEAGQIQKA